jgi:serine/threonine protein kinase
MRICHSYDIVHRDLKPDNVFLSDRFAPVIADFGLSKCLQGSVELSNHCGTPLFMAPEMHEGTSTEKPIDVYAYAMIIYCLLGGVTPKGIVFKGQKAPTVTAFTLSLLVIDGVRPTPLPGKIPDSWQRVIDLCWSNGPEARPTFDQVVAILEDDRGLLLDGANEAEYRQYIEDCHAEVTDGQAMPASLAKSYGTVAGRDAERETIVTVSGGPPAPSPPAGTGRRARGSRNFEWK